MKIDNEVTYMYVIKTCIIETQQLVCREYL